MTATVSEDEFKELWYDRTEYYIELGYSDEKAEGLAACDIQEKYDYVVGK